MNETTKLNSTFAIAMIALISSLGVPISNNMFEDELKDYYVCDVDEAHILEFLGGISGTGYSGYPYQGSRKSAVYCKSNEGVKGKWIKVAEYAKSMGIDPYDLIEKKTPTKEQETKPITGKSYICPPLKECTEVTI